MKKLLAVLSDDRGGEVMPQAAVYTAAFVFGTFLLAHHYHRWRDMFCLVVVTGVRKDNKLLFERNFARDRYAFRAPAGREVEKWQERGVPNHRNEWYQDAQLWRWRGDVMRRTFIVPTQLAQNMMLSHFARDVMAAVITLFRTTPSKIKGPRTVLTTIRELCRILNLPCNGENCERVGLTLAILRSVTIRDQDVPIKKGSKVEWVDQIYGWIDCVTEVTHVQVGEDENEDPILKPLPPRRRRLEITLSKQCVDLLEKASFCTIPVAALAAARRLSSRQVVPAKNLIYYLAARSDHEARLRWETVAEVAGLRGRWPGERQRACRNLLVAMARTGIVSFAEDRECVTITLLGVGKDDHPERENATL